jgi:hypothetical protein
VRLTPPTLDAVPQKLRSALAAAPDAAVGYHDDDNRTVGALVE